MPDARGCPNSGAMLDRPALALLLTIWSKFDRDEWRTAISMVLGQATGEVVVSTLGMKAEGGLILPSEIQVTVVCAIMGALASLSPRAASRVKIAVSKYGKEFGVTGEYARYAALFRTQPQAHWIARADQGLFPDL